MAPRTRRALLSSLGAVALAGCVTSNSPPESPTGTPPDTDSPPPTHTDTPVDSPSSAHTDAAWPGPGYDHRRTFHAPTTGPTSAVGEAWSVAPGPTLSAPAVGGGQVVVGGADGSVFAFDLGDGSRRWDVDVGASAGAPRLRDGRVYLPVERADGGAAIVALDPADGTKRWRAETGPIGGLVVAPHGCYSIAPQGESGSIVARTLADGAERWRTRLDGDWTGHLFAGSERVYATVGGSGRPWSLSATTGETAQDRRIAAEDGSFAQCFRDGTVFAAEDFFGTVDAWATSGGAYDRRWGASLDAYTGFELAVDDDRVYLHGEHGDRPGLYALDRADGSEGWHAGDVGPLRGRPVGGTAVVVVRTTDRLVGVDPADGTERWAVEGGVAGAAIALAGEQLVTVDGATLRVLVSG